MVGESNNLPKTGGGKSARRVMTGGATGSASTAAGDDLVRTLNELAKDVERFESMIRNQRHLLQRHEAGDVTFDEKLIRRQSRRIRAGAADIVTRTRGALETLRSSPDVAEIVLLETAQRRRRDD